LTAITSAIVYPRLALARPFKNVQTVITQDFFTSGDRRERRERKKKASLPGY